MLNLIVTFLFALAVAYFAIQNMYTVPLVVANNVFPSVPVYVIIIASVLLGIVLTSLIMSIDSFATYLKLRGKDHEIQHDEKIIAELQEKMHDLEVSNVHLQNQLRSAIEQRTSHVPTVERAETKSEQTVHKPSFFHGLFRPRTSNI